MKTLAMFLLICAVMALTNAAGENHINRRSTSCPSGWSEYKGRCFLFISTKETWADAEKDCLNRGGHLASVHRSSEHNFIRTYILGIAHSSPLTWLGGSEQEGTWFWSDGTSFDFTYWAKGQPDDSGSCLVMNYRDDRKFDDERCSNKKPFVCAMKP
ncbi:ladderlectin-like [Cheilinus undulatus]|uniref:ladderlectin-like n=1 Tax=Cheilinus undulatus TaxID=241271 RepID=UPI001BD486C8|nr:ladderlectin-like [Cheilinus undulatus]